MIEIKVGDYVETKEGEVGYIINVSDMGITWWQKGLNREMWIGNKVDLFINFNRIGEYDFTKEDKSIKKISLIASTVNDKVLCFEGMSNEDLLWKLTNKVNEIIDCLNKKEGK